MYARLANIKFSSAVKKEVVRVAQGLAQVLRNQRGFESLQVLTDTDAGEAIIVSFWETEADAEVRGRCLYPHTPPKNPPPVSSLSIRTYALRLGCGFGGGKVA